MKTVETFTWDCPRCAYRTTVDLPVGENAELRCARCKCTIGQDTDSDDSPPELPDSQPAHRSDT